MKKTISVVMFCFSFFACQVNIQAEILEIQNAPYIHQVLDMDTDVFIGHNACGSTSAVMMTEFHNFHPGSSQLAGTYVYSPYVGFTDKSGKDYHNPVTLSYIDSGNGPYDMTISGSHIHEIESGAHGYMIINGGSAESPYWGTSQGLFEGYLENHGLITNPVSSDMFSVIKRNIKSGLPLIGHWTGHYIFKKQLPKSSVIMIELFLFSNIPLCYSCISQLVS